MDIEKTDLLDQLFRLQALLRHRHILHHHHRGPLGAPHHGQGRILSLLKLKPEMSQKELSTILDIRSQSLGELLTKLEGQGYLVRTPSEVDRRSLNVRLTDEGRKATEQLDDTPESERFFECLNPEEQQTLSTYLDRLIGALEAEVGPTARPEDQGPGRGPWGRGDRLHRGEFGHHGRGRL